MKPITELLWKQHENGIVYPIITAHSGCEGTPDNSIAHIKTAIASGAECFEIDINAAPDGMLYLTHDKPSSYEGIPLFEECLKLAAADEKIMINCDVKTEWLKAPVIALAKKYGMESRILFTGSYHLGELTDLDASEADWWVNIFHNTEESISSAISACDSTGGTYRILNLHYGMVNDAFAARTRKAGYPLSVWTVNNEEGLRRMMTYPEVWNITTRIPKMALQIRKEIFGV